MSQLRQQSQWREWNVAVLVVTFQSGYMERAYVEQTGLDWPLLIDESRSLYRAYEMERGRLRNILGFRSLWAYLKLVFRGRRPRMSTGDPLQLGGDVLIDPEGIVRLHHVGSGPADRPSVESLLDIVRRGRDGE